MTVVIENEEKNEEEDKKVESIATEYQGYRTIAKIEIPRIGLNTYVLENVTVDGMKVAPCFLYTTGEINKSGNSLIVGHNYQNGTLFSNNKNIIEGDKIIITSLDGSKIEYTVYSKFITTSEDITFLKRDTNNSPEITLQSCTDNNNDDRLIILAKIM